MVWSPDGSIMYFIESTTGEIIAWDYSVATAEISNERVVFSLKEHGFRVDFWNLHYFLDGVTIDSMGYLYAPYVGTGEVSVIYISLDRNSLVLPIININWKVYHRKRDLKRNTIQI